MWKIKQHKTPKSQQDLRVKVLLNEMAEYSYATNADEIELQFKRLIKEIPKTNSFEAGLMYKVTPRNKKSVEVWKMTVTGDFKTKMYQLDFVDEKNDI